MLTKPNKLFCYTQTLFTSLTMNVATKTNATTGVDDLVRNFTTTHEPLKKHDHSFGSNLTTSVLSLRASFGSLDCDHSAETKEDWNGTHQQSSESQKPCSPTNMLNDLLDRAYIEPDEQTDTSTLDKETHAILEQVLFDFSDLSTWAFPGSNDNEDTNHSSSNFSVFGHDSIRLTKRRQLKMDSKAEGYVE